MLLFYRYSSHRVFQMIQLILLYCCIILLIFPRFSTAYMYFNNITYPSLPALFGRFMMDGRMYDARIQYFHENPYLCELDEKTINKFVPSKGPSIPSHDGTNISLIGEPIAILASRGNCPFQRKAAIAESIHESIRFLIVYNFNIDGTPDQEDTLVPMYSQFGNTRLVLLSISHRTALALKQYISVQTNTVLQNGGPLIEFDSEPPPDYITADDLQSLILSALGLFFMLISFTGCLVILAGTFSQLVNNPNGNSIVITAGQRRLLTEEEVHQFAFNNNNNSSSSSSRPSALSLQDERKESEENLVTTHEEGGEGEEEEHQCAVCIDDFDETSEITALPCKHMFHTDCILPWLTERQSKCPLCKFDVLQYIREQNNNNNNNEEEDCDECDNNHNNENNIDNSNNNNNRGASFWDQIRRYRWMTVQLLDEDDGIMMIRDNSITSSSDRDNDNNNDDNLTLQEEGVELTNQRHITTA